MHNSSSNEVATFGLAMIAKIVPKSSRNIFAVEGTLLYAAICGAAAKGAAITFTETQLGIGTFDDTGNFDDVIVYGKKVDRPEKGK